MNQVVVFLIFLSPFVYYVFANLEETKKTDTIFKFFFYGDDFTPRKFAATLVATNAGLSSAFYLILFYGAQYGFAVFPFVWSFWFITQKASAVTIAKTESVMASRGGWIGRYGGLHDFLGERFESTSVRRLAGMLSVLAYLGLIACEIVLAYEVIRFVLPGGEHIGGSRFTSHASIAMAAVTLAIFAYTAAAGFRGVIRTDIFQLFLMALMVTLVGAFAFKTILANTADYSRLYDTSLSGWLVNPDRAGAPYYLSFVVANVFFWGLWWPGAQDQWQRCAATKSHSESIDRLWGTTGLIPSLYFGVLSLVFVAAGAALVMNGQPRLLTPDSLATIVGQSANALGDGLGAAIIAGIIGSGLLSASMSTIDTFVNVAALSFYSDSVRAKTRSIAELERQDIGTHRHLAGARATSLLMIVPVFLVVLSTLLVTDVYELIYAAFSFMFAILPSLGWALWGNEPEKRAKGAKASLIGGGLVSTVGYFFIIRNLEHAFANQADPFVAYQWLYWWPIVTALVGLIVLAFYPKSDRASVGGS